MSPLLQKKTVEKAPADKTDLELLKEVLHDHDIDIPGEIQRKKDEAARQARVEQDRIAREEADAAYKQKRQAMVKAIIASPRVIFAINEQPVGDVEFTCPACGLIYGESSTMVSELADFFIQKHIDPERSFLEQVGYRRGPAPAMGVYDQCPCGKVRRFSYWVMP